jgi:phosphoribosylformylglycinamidine cyclo-ligase
LHTNGYSLARKIVGLTGDRDADLARLAERLPDGTTVGDALLAEHPTYLPAVWPLLERGVVKGIAHITGGGLIDNVPRMLPAGVAAQFDPGTWEAPAIFAWLVERGRIPLDDRYRALNMGIGLVLAVASADVDAALAGLAGSRVIGTVVARGGEDDPQVRGLDRSPGARG